MTGSLFVVSAPSGAGKTTLVRALLERDPTLKLSVSYTTRTPREGEVDGVAYHFIPVADFLACRDAGEFLEWAQVHRNYYATSRIWLEQQIRAGNDVLLEIDWQGAAQVRKIFPAAIAIFIMPPSIEVLDARLRGRGTDSEEVIRQRVAAAHDEMRQVDRFDYVIINNNLRTALEELETVVRASRLRTAVMRERFREVFPPAA